MKGGHLHAPEIRPEEFLDPCLHFLGGLVRKGKCKDPPWRDLLCAYQISYL